MSRIADGLSVAIDINNAAAARHAAKPRLIIARISKMRPPCDFGWRQCEREAGHQTKTDNVNGSKMDEGTGKRGAKALAPRE
jgi:hypothetical protein